MEITFETSAGHKSVTVPELVREVTYSQFLDWRSPVRSYIQEILRKQEAERKAQEAPKKRVEITTENFHEFSDSADQPGDVEEQKVMTEAEILADHFKMFVLMVQMGQHFEDEGEILAIVDKSLGVLVSGDLGDVDFHDGADDLVLMLKEGVDFFDEGGITKMRLLCHLCCLFRNYIAKLAEVTLRYSVEHVGEKYYIEPRAMERVADATNPVVGTISKRYTTDEVMEVMELRRFFEGAILDRGDTDGALEFQMELALLAVLLRKDGERLPPNRAERKRWIDIRAHHFKSLPMDVVYDVRNFFLTSLKTSLLTLITQATLEKGRVFPNLKLATGVHSEKPRNTPKRSGNLSIRR